MPLPAEVLDIARRIAEHGGRAYLVGGCVRDQRLGLKVSDWDLEAFGIEASALLGALRERYRILDVGRSYGVLKIEGVPVDVSLPRRETKVGRGHKGFAVDTDPGLGLREAAERRDLSINALYHDPLTEEVEDPMGGLADLEARRLRHCSDRFPEDPLRVLRVMQFAARFGFEVDPATVELCRGIDLHELAAERVAGEWRKLLLRGREPSRGLRFLVDAGATRFFPPLESWGPEVWERVGRALDAAVRSRSTVAEDQLARSLALLGGECDDALMRERLLAQLCPRHETVARAQALVTRLSTLDEWEAARRADPVVRRAALELPLHELVGVWRAQDRSRESIDAFEAAARRLGVLEEAPRPWIQGRDLIELGARPGPAMGEVLERVFAAQLDGEVRSRDEAFALARRTLLRGRDA